MKDCFKFVYQAFSSGQSLLSHAFTDPFEAARHLLNSTDTRERLLGLRRLSMSDAPEALPLALVRYRFSADPTERFKAESCLVTLTLRSSAPAGEAALAIVHSQSRMGDSFVHQRMLRHSSYNLSRILQTGRVPESDLRTIDHQLARWEAQLGPIHSQRLCFVLNELANPRTTALKAAELRKAVPSAFSRLNSRLHFAFALQAVRSEHADQLRVNLLRSLAPGGAYTNVVLRTMHEHRHRPAVREALTRIFH